MQSEYAAAGEEDAPGRARPIDNERGGIHKASVVVSWPNGEMACVAPNQSVKQSGAVAIAVAAAIDDDDDDDGRRAGEAARFDASTFSPYLTGFLRRGRGRGLFHRHGEVAPPIVANEPSGGRAGGRRDERRCRRNGTNARPAYLVHGRVPHGVVSRR